MRSRVSKQTVQFCVVSSADQNLGCFIDRASAEEQQRATGQQRLLDVIGQTARLEERPVLAVVPPGDPAYASTPVTCAATEAERDSPSARSDALEPAGGRLPGRPGGNKFRLGPAVISGGDIAEATAIFGGTTGGDPVGGARSS